MFHKNGYRRGHGKEKGTGCLTETSILPPCFSAPPGHLPQGEYLNVRLVWRIRSFWTLICPSKFVFGTVTVQVAGVYLV